MIQMKFGIANQIVIQVIVPCTYISFMAVTMLGVVLCLLSPYLCCHCLNVHAAKSKPWLTVQPAPLTKTIKYYQQIGLSFGADDDTDSDG